jgi:Fe-S cluster assembly protein SufD
MMTERVVRKITRKTSAEPLAPREFTFERAAVRGLVDTPDFLANYRARAWEAYQNTPLPTTSDEAWRRTDLKGLEMGSLRLPADVSDLNLPSVPDELLQPLVDQEHGGQIVLTAQGVQLDMNESITRQGVIFTDLATAEREHPQILEKIMGKVVRYDEGKFAALASALAQTGVLVYVPKNVQLEEPLHSILWGPASGLAYITHLMVYVDDGASLTYIHESASPTEPHGQSFHTGIVEVYVGDNAHLRFVELQSWGEHVWNFTHERARVGRDSSLDWIVGTLGSHLTKTFADLDLVEQGASGRMSGFYFTDGRQHLDFDTQQNHMAPHTTSDLLFKGALEGQSRSVWQGMIYVAPGAQKTDGYQANRNLILSRTARADSIPGLEILADDVRCTHGATVGKIDPEMVFYLLTRGVRQRDAERLIVEGFFDPVMQRIPYEGVRARFQDAIVEKMR